MSDKVIFGHDLANVYNINESVVATIIEKILSTDTGICSCETCVEDMFALALNKVPSKYIQNDFREHEFSKMIDSEKMEQAVEEAVNKVSKHHNHA